MEAIALQSNSRIPGGKGAARRLRAAGRVPAVVYGHGVESPVAVSLDPKALNKALENPKKDNALFAVALDEGQAHTVLVREIQRHPLSRAILHVDLVSPDLTTEMVSTVPLSFIGKSIGVSMGGRLRTPYREIKVLSKPSDIPASIEIDLGPMQIGDSVTVTGLDLPEGVVAVYERDFVIAKVLKPRGGGKKTEEGE